MERKPGLRWLVMGALLALLVTTVALGAGTRTAQAQDPSAVSIVDFAFQPAMLQIATGTTVTWTNTGNAPHTATADDGSFDSGQLSNGQTFSQTFNTAGTFTYHCDVHPFMTAMITVS
jgi:plastocyanin